RLHILNFVAGLRLPRNWEFGTRVLLQSGTPLTTIFGHNVSRSDGQFRLDLRVDKRAVWNGWLLDFYVDVINSTVSAESGGLVGVEPGQPLRLLLVRLVEVGILEGELLAGGRAAADQALGFGLRLRGERVVPFHRHAPGARVDRRAAPRVACAVAMRRVTHAQ